MNSIIFLIIFYLLQITSCYEGFDLGIGWRFGIQLLSIIFIILFLYKIYERRKNGILEQKHPRKIQK